MKLVIRDLVSRPLDHPDTDNDGLTVMSDTELTTLVELVALTTLQVALAGIEFGPSAEEAVYAYWGIKNGD